jgi:hypothetical protein
LSRTWSSESAVVVNERRLKIVVSLYSRLAIGVALLMTISMNNCLYKAFNQRSYERSSRRTCRPKAQQITLDRVRARTIHIECRDHENAIPSRNVELLGALLIEW